MTDASPVPIAVSRKTFFILNPNAGSCNKNDLLQVIDQLRESVGLQCRVYITQGDDNYKQIIAQALDDGYEVIAACGGDGTVSAVASELVGKSACCMIVPAGTANVLAKELGIPQDQKEALSLITGPLTVKHIDAMKVDGKHFFSHVSLGVYSKIAEQTKPEVKRKFGRFAYIWFASKLMFWKKSWRFKIIADGKALKARGTTIMIASAGAVGGLGLRWSPKARADSGEVSVCIIKARTFGEYFRLAFSMFRNSHADSKLIQIVQARRSLLIQNKSHLPIRGDGEIIGHNDLEITIIANALKIMVPAGK